MVRSSKTRRLVAGLLLPMFFIASVFCVCASEAAAFGAVAGHAEAHACCAGEEAPDGHDAPSGGDEHSSCQHCNPNQLTEPSSVKVPSPVLSAAQWALSPVFSALTLSATASTAFSHKELPVLFHPPSVLKLICVLLI